MKSEPLDKASKHFGHRFPDNHPEANFADHVESIPKKQGDYGVQGEYIKRLVKDTNWKVRRILDVGAGEGTFTLLVLNLLKENGALAPSVKLDVIEKTDALWALCEAKLRSSMPSVRLDRIPVNAVAEARYELPCERDALLEWSDSFGARNEYYDLVLVSHVTYYFDNAGVDLAYALLSRLLAPTGWAWFVVRDRRCPFYQFRDELLAARQMPDINRDCFSDAFLDRARCLIRDNGESPPPLFTQSRSFSLEIAQNQSPVPLVEYLYWLEGLSESEAGKAIDKARNDGFSESHIWMRMQQIADAKEPDYSETGLLADIHVIGRCIDMIRRVAPEIETYYVSLARLKPSKGAAKTNHPGHSTRFDLPVFHHSNFLLYSLGYTCEAERDDSKARLLNGFFEKNTSFLFYPRFFHDYVAGSGGPDLSFIRALGRAPKKRSPADYRYRKAGPLRAPYSVTSEFPLDEAVDAWNELLGAYYGEDFRGGDDKASQQRLWSICVGCNVLPDSASQARGEDLLHTCCALFLTVATPADVNLDAATQHFVGHIKTHLAQWMAKHLYDTSCRQFASLEKQAQTLQLLTRPLRRLSDAMSTMQSDSQELRALLFEPEETLFKSFASIEQFFNEGAPLPVEFTGSAAIRCRHTPDMYADPDRGIVLACVLCAIFGQTEELAKELKKGAHAGIAEAMAISSKLLSRKAADAATANLAADLLWLIREGNDFDKAIYEVLGADKEKQMKALANIKNALFLPFKSDAMKWHSIALRLLQRSETLSRAVLGGELKVSRGLTRLDTPVGYSAVLAFIRDIATALSSSYKYVTQLEWTYECDAASKLKSCRCSLVFNEDIPDSEAGIDRHHLAGVLAVVAEHCPREWRIQDDNYGDRTRPFVYLVNKVLGLGSDRHSEWEVNTPQHADKNIVLAIRQTRRQSPVQFVVRVERQAIRLVWTETQ